MIAGPPRLSYGEAYLSPWSVAERWRTAGGRVVGMLGYRAPRELVVAAGMLPVRLSPERLSAPDVDPGRVAADGARSVVEALAGELDRRTLSVLGALLDGRLSWVDALLIGRDRETHTRLFYALRELADDAEFAARIPPFAFCDSLTLPLRTSAVYNRRRLAELARTVAGWGERAVLEIDLRAAIDALARVDAQLHALNRLRLEGRSTGTELLIAAGAAQTLPPDEAHSALATAVTAAATRPVHRLSPRVFVTGSDVERPDPYECLEAAGLAIVGEDHSWGVFETAGELGTTAPLSWIADRYQFSQALSARAGLSRAAHTARRAAALEVDAVLQLVAPDDESAGWELDELRRKLPSVPVVSAVLDGDDGAGLVELAAEIAAQAGSHGAPGPGARSVG